jgi:hypothetical protein
MQKNVNQCTIYGYTVLFVLCFYTLGDSNGQKSHFRIITRGSVLGYRQHGISLHPAKLLPLQPSKIGFAVSR